MRRRLRLIAAAATGLAALTVGLSGAAPVAGVDGQTVTVTVRDVLSPANPRASTWGRVISSPAGIDCPGDCKENFSRGSTVVLTVLSKPGYTFLGWGLDKARPSDCQNARTCSLTIDGDVRVRAVLQPGAQLLATTEGAGKLVLDPVDAGRPAGACADRVTQDRERAHSGACFQRYPNGTRVTIRAVVDKAVRGARFVGWSDYRCPRRRLSCTLTMRGEHYLTAIFDPVFLKVVEGTFGDLISPSARCTFVLDPSESARACKIPYPLNALVTLKRKPRAGDQSFWHGACWGVGRTCTVRMHTNRWVQAGPRSELPSATPGSGVGESIRLEYAGPRGGTLIIRPVTYAESPTSCRRTCSARFGHGDLVEIRAKSGSGVRFRRWADTNARSTIRRIRIGTRNPVRAIFVRR